MRVRSNCVEEVCMKVHKSRFSSSGYCRSYKRLLNYVGEIQYVTIGVNTDFTVNLIHLLSIHFVSFKKLFFLFFFYLFIFKKEEKQSLI